MLAKSPYEAAFDDLPEEWGEVPIVELGKVLSGSTPSRDVPTYWGGDIPWVTPGELTGLRSKYISQTIEAITPDGLNGSGANLLPQNSLLITTRATLGSRAINTRPMATNQGFKSIVFKNPTDANYYYHWAEKLVPELTRRASGTTFLEISGSQFCQIRVPNPPESERIKIAQILDTLDIQIRQTEALIAKLEHIKQGLLTDLLPRGIDQSGQLRPTPDQAPHLYKDSPLGQIPREWEIRALRDVSENITDGTHQAVKTVPPSGNTVPFLYVSCVRNGEILWDKAAAITNSDYLEISKGRVPNKGMVLYTAVGSYGHAAVTSTDQSFAFQRHIACIYPANETVRPNFIGNFLNSETTRAYADRVALGNAQKTVTLGELSNFPILLPPSSEQDQIIMMLTEQDCLIDREHWLLKKLQITKTGLMGDLLTGRIRVTPLLEEAQQRKG